MNTVTVIAMAVGLATLITLWTVGFIVTARIYRAINASLDGPLPIGGFVIHYVLAPLSVGIGVITAKAIHKEHVYVESLAFSVASTVDLPRSVLEDIIAKAIDFPRGNE